MAVVQGTHQPLPKAPPEPEPNPFEAIAQTISKTVQATANTAVVTIVPEVGSLIPSDVSVSLTTLGYSDPELRKAARLAAKMYDVYPQAYGIPAAKLKDYTDPITGGPLRAATFRRMMEGAESAVFADMLQQAVVLSGPSRAHGGREGRQEPTPDRTNAYFSTISRIFRDTDIDAPTAIGLAIALSEDASLSPRKVERNLDAVKRWGAIHGETDWEVLFGLDAQAAKNGTVFREVSDVDRAASCCAWSAGILGHVLHPTDFSDGAEGAFLAVEEIVRRARPRVTLLHVQDEVRLRPHLEHRLEEFDRIDAERLSRMAHRLTELGVPEVRSMIVHGRPIPLVIEQCRREEVTLVVLGCQGRGFVREVFLGSVASALARHSPVPVFVPLPR